MNAIQRGEIVHSGYMVHFVIPQIDAGEVITQTIVPVEPDDTLETFEARMHAAEHHITVEAIRVVARAQTEKTEL